MMRANVKTDHATRVIELDLEPDGPAWDLHDVTATWRAKPRTFRPDKARLILKQGATGWEVRSISLSGQLVLKSGSTSDSRQSRDSMTWEQTGGWRKEASLTLAPEWVQEIAQQAPGGITGFIWTDSERAQEVQERG
jgi:hypothetical protein